MTRHAKLKTFLLATLGTPILRFWSWSQRMRYELPRPPGPVILASWHQRILGLVSHFGRRGTCILNSDHRDGEIMSRICRRLGYQSVRGSSTRGGVRALVGMIRVAREGKADLALTPDGPRGPARQVQPGVVYLASKTGLPVLPLSASVAGSRELGSWDHQHVPPFFGRGVLRAGAPVYVPKGLDEAQEQEWTDKIRAGIDEATDAADRDMAAQATPLGARVSTRLRVGVALLAVAAMAVLPEWEWVIGSPDFGALALKALALVLGVPFLLAWGAGGVPLEGLAWAGLGIIACAAVAPEPPWWALGTGLPAAGAYLGLRLAFWRYRADGPAGRARVQIVASVLGLVACLAPLLASPFLARLDGPARVNAAAWCLRVSPLAGAASLTQYDWLRSGFMYRGSVFGSDVPYAYPAAATQGAFLAWSGLVLFLGGFLVLLLRQAWWRRRHPFPWA